MRASGSSSTCAFSRHPSVRQASQRSGGDFSSRVTEVTPDRHDARPWYLCHHRQIEPILNETADALWRSEQPVVSGGSPAACTVALTSHCHACLFDACPSLRQSRTACGTLFIAASAKNIAGAGRTLMRQSRPSLSWPTPSTPNRRSIDGVNQRGQCTCAQRQQGQPAEELHEIGARMSDKTAPQCPLEIELVATFSALHWSQFAAPGEG
jgi:hypothetical protein